MTKAIFQPLTVPNMVHHPTESRTMSWNGKHAKNPVLSGSAGTWPSDTYRLAYSIPPPLPTPRALHTYACTSFHTPQSHTTQKVVGHKHSDFAGAGRLSWPQGWRRWRMTPPCSGKSCCPLSQRTATRWRSGRQVRGLAPEDGVYGKVSAVLRESTSH